LNDLHVQPRPGFPAAHSFLRTNKQNSETAYTSSCPQERGRHWELEVFADVLREAIASLSFRAGFKTFSDI